MKTYRFVDHQTPLSEESIESLYSGYWVYCVKAKFTETNGFIEGIPVIIGEKAYDGGEDGIYEQYKTEEYSERVGLSFLKMKILSQACIL